MKVLIPFLSYFLIMGGLIIQVFIPGFPKETLLFQAGASFGIFWGSLLNWLGMVLAAQLAYEVVRRSIEQGGKYSSILQDYQESKFLKKMETSGNLGLFFLRLFPFSPNDILSLLAGALKLPRKGFVLVSLITATPYAIVFAYLGYIGSQYVDIWLILKINAVLIVLTSSITLILHFRRKKREDPSMLDYPEN